MTFLLTSLNNFLLYLKILGQCQDICLLVYFMIGKLNYFFRFWIVKFEILTITSKKLKSLSLPVSESQDLQHQFQQFGPWMFCSRTGFGALTSQSDKNKSQIKHVSSQKYFTEYRLIIFFFYFSETELRVPSTSKLYSLKKYVNFKLFPNSIHQIQ